MKSNWDKHDIDTLNDATLSNGQVADALGRSEAAVRGKRQRLAKKMQVKTFPAENAPLHAVLDAASSYEQDRERVGGDHWKRQHADLRAKYEKLLRERNIAEVLVEAVRESAPESYQTAPPIVRKTKSAGKPQAMLVLLSDTHAGAVVRKEQTGGSGGYSFSVFLARLKFYEDAIVSILRDHTTTAVPELVLCLGGDMLDGALNHSAEVGQVNTIFSQFYGAGHAIAQFIRAVAAHVPKVRVYCTAGNHTRFQNQHKMPTVNRFSSFDTFLYALLESLTKDISNVLWNLDEQPFADFDIFGFKFRLLHGDTLRGMDRAMGIPSHSVGRLISATTSICEKEGRPAPSYYICGHLHRSISLPTAKGAFLVGGAFVGLDGFGLSQNFTPVDPSQMVFFVHQKYGRTASYEISLKHAVVTDVPPYTIPGNFPLQ